MAEVGAFLQAQAQVLLAAGVAAERIALDPDLALERRRTTI